MIRRRHRMPFGTEVLQDGRIRFRLWAPAARDVRVCLGGRAPDVELPMATEPEGWFGLITELASVGSHYRFRIDGDLQVPDPASRQQAEDVHGPSQVVDPLEWPWEDEDWKGRAWEEAVIYELHVGSFTPEGNFTAIKSHLDHLVDLGVTAIELMPVADFPGQRNWGYDGTLLFAPDRRYGSPEDLKDLVQAAHAKGLMVFLDVVYNHFGPEGNYLHAYAPAFFTERHHTPWGAAINFDGSDSGWVRQFFIHNALFWLEEYHLDGLRLDAVHAIIDQSQPDVLQELADRVRRGPGMERPIHLILENYDNAAHYLERSDDRAEPRWYTAQWNDDIHHAVHVLSSGESGGYYADYADDPARHLGRCLTEGFAYQGEPSRYQDGRRRGEPSTHVPLTAFVSFLQNHDQIGNRAFGERLHQLAEPEAVQAVLAVLLLAPSPPMLFMGEEWGTQKPFPFFCDFGPELAAAVTEGRRREFARFPEFSDPAARARIPDPESLATFESAVLDWAEPTLPQYREWLEFYRSLLALRRREIVPRIRGLRPGGGAYQTLGNRALSVRWSLADGSVLAMVANLSPNSLQTAPQLAGRVLYSVNGEPAQAPAAAWSVVVTLQEGQPG